MLQRNANIMEKLRKDSQVLLNGSGKLDYFASRGIGRETVARAGIGYRAGAFTYPCNDRTGTVLGVHYKGMGRDAKGKRPQRWGDFNPDLPSKENGAPAKVIPFGLETLVGIEPGSLVVLTCGEEDALSLRQVGYVAISQPGAGLLEPAYASEFRGLDVAVFYAAGEEREAYQDACKLEAAGADTVRMVEWPLDAPHGSDINAQVVENPSEFEEWIAIMIAAAKTTGHVGEESLVRAGQPDAYAAVPGPEPGWPELANKAFYGLPGSIVRAIEPHTEADPVAVLVSLLAAFGNAIGRGAFFRVGADVHHLKLNVGLVGDTSKGRKGMSWNYVRDLMSAADEWWTEERVSTASRPARGSSTPSGTA